MKALRFFEPGRVAVVNVPDPHAGPGEVVLKVHATGLCNSDVRVYLGEKKAAAGVIPGHEMSGEIAESGVGVELPIGQVVSVCPILCCGRCSFCRDGFRNRCPSRRTLGYDLDGAIAEYVRIPAPLVAMGHLLEVDASVAPHLRALLEPFACVLNSIEALAIGAGTDVAIVGGGPMGLLHLIAARAYGAANVMVVEPEAERSAVALELGADIAVAPEEALAAGRELTKGEGFPAVAMAVGLAAAAPLALDLARRLGHINLFAGFPPGSNHTFDLNRIHYDEVRILGTQNAPFHLYGKAARLIPRLPHLDRVVTNRYALDDAADAYTARLGKAGLKSAVVVHDQEGLRAAKIAHQSHRSPP
jgi:L-iditol 2-dehydrogenase